LETKMRKKLEEEGIPDKYDGPSAAQIASYQKMMKVRDGLVNFFVVGTYNALVAPIVRTIVPKKSPEEGNGKLKYLQTSIPPNTPRIVDTLMRVHGYQLLVDGMFNADPHGGNFLLLPDGRIGLIDYGATKRLSENERITACVLFAALQRKDKEMLWQMGKMGGYKSKYMDPEVYYKLVQFGYNTWGKEVTGGKNVQQFMDELKATDPYYETPDNFVLASFMSVRLRALTLGMNHPVKCSEYWAEIAEKELNRLGLPYETWDEAQLLKYQPELNIQKFDM
jgi:predicted unusual protein kinase regulating ubiquinone biosynthesis (AarF/ABC1/UbiB family)